MKNLLLVILAATSIVFANTELPIQDNTGGLYIVAGVGGSYANISHIEFLTDHENYKGIGVNLDLRLGWSLSKLLSVHGTFNASRMHMKLSHTYDGLFGNNSTFNASATLPSLFTGGGVTIYPITNPNSKIKDIYGGISVGYLTYHTDDSSGNDTFGVEGKGMGLMLEAGKNWKIGDNWGIGIGGAWIIGVFGHETSHVPQHSSEDSILGFNQLGIQFRVFRR